MGKQEVIRRLAVSALSLLPASARRRNLIERAVKWTLASEKADIRGEINIVFVGRKRMRELNEQFLGHSHDTDVIAFRYDSAPPKGDEAPFGDVFISAYQAGVQAKQLGHPVLTEALTLVVHGTLHLLGYGDATPRQKTLMFSKQSRCLAALGRL